MTRKKLEKSEQNNNTRRNGKDKSLSKKMQLHEVYRGVLFDFKGMIISILYKKTVKKF